MDTVRDQQRSPFSRPGFVVSAVLVGMLVLATAFVAVTGLTRHDAHSSQHIAASDAVGQRVQRTARTPRPAGCSLAGDSEAVPTAAPSLAWTTVGEMVVPQSPGTFGPERRQDGIGVCFAHDPTGALVASLDFFAEATVASPTGLLRTRTASGAGQQVALLQARGGDGGLLQDSDGDPGSVSAQGYQYIDYTPSEANIDVALQGPDGQLASVECQLIWQHADWKLVIPTSGQLNATQITTMDGFIAWAAVGADTPSLGGGNR
jgi:hypothetical protein